MITVYALFWLNTKLKKIVRNNLKKANHELTTGIGEIETS